MVKTQEYGLVCGFRIAPDGKARPLTLEESDGPFDDDDGWTWLHFDLMDPPSAEWFARHEEIDRNIAQALLRPGTRPRFERGPDGYLLILRGVNLNPGRDPEDMVAVRLWAERRRIITTRREKVLAIQAIRDLYNKGQGPRTPNEFLIALGNGLVERMSSVIDELQDTIDELEDNMVLKLADQQRGRLLKLRSRTIQLRRYLSPQRDALTEMMTSEVKNFSDYERGAMRLVADRISRYAEDLDAVRDRAAAVHEEISAQLAEEMNRTMFRLGIVATIFLPLSLLTGLLGINVGGMPGTEDPWAFWLVTVLVIGMGVGGYYLMKKWEMI